MHRPNPKGLIQPLMMGSPWNCVPGRGYLGAGVCCWDSKNTKEEKGREEEEGSILDCLYPSCHCRVSG